MLTTAGKAKQQTGMSSHLAAMLTAEQQPKTSPQKLLCVCVAEAIGLCSEGAMVKLGCTDSISQ